MDKSMLTTLISEFINNPNYESISSVKIVANENTTGNEVVFELRDQKKPDPTTPVYRDRNVSEHYYRSVPTVTSPEDESVNDPSKYRID